ncbi:alpha/beta hydrolase [Streptomyces sp. Ru73]|uniref:alpha/beta hydrolase n=1 Tax=Streptomyces sp. Ru73 TaxID=2080748 RepID=UPI000CDE13FD|nr:alpha/beta hydrolase [Streptomyces sp. Ru73]POX41570.1 alpha/beta hydrolase [Streptomyces sp. Ru73]
MTVDLEVDVEAGLPYGPGGKLLDVYRPAAAAVPPPAVLLWHGIGPDERDVLAPLARAAAALGAVVFVPDWRPDAEDRGRAHLLESLAYVREQAARHGADPERTVLAGWSTGATSAVGAVLDPDAVGGWRPSAVVGIAGRFDIPDRFGGAPALERIAAGAVPAAPVLLAHGSTDPVVPAQHSRDLADALRARELPVTLAESAADHAGVIMTAYDPARNRCVGTADEDVLRAGRGTAELLARAAG